MGYNIRPLSFAEVLDRAFQVFRDHFSVLAGISAVLWLPYGAILAVDNTSQVVFVIAEIALLILLPVMSVALTAAVASLYLDLPITVGDAYRSIRIILTPIVGTYLMLYLLVILVASILLPRYWAYVTAAVSFILFGGLLELSYFGKLPS